MIAVVTILMLAGVAWSLTTCWERWCRCGAGSGEAPRVGLRCWLVSSAIHLGQFALLLISRAWLSLPPTLLIVPDLGYLIVISSVVAVVWGMAQPVTYSPFAGRRADRHE